MHCCHCRDCQRITGSAFVVNLWMERQHVELRRGEPKTFALKGGSGQPHTLFFCGDCGCYVWGRYHRAPGDTVMLRAISPLASLENALNGRPRENKTGSPPARGRRGLR